MPIFDDRFARQNRCEPPPEFPLASPYTGIVHLLSGPAPYALTQIHPRTSGSGFDTRTLAYEDDSLVRVSRRVVDDHYASILADARTSVPQGITRWAITLPEESHIPAAFIPRGKLMLAWTGKVHWGEPQMINQAQVWS
ncbi:hypothetical protein FoTM2_006395 [Fusarium oxysporum f. sp. vasinfectum]|nr:hypothetical protein FoTM2_006394 [Fusarium oxysporum f. sp. vasinfectum]KAK2931939.1 hypothetical protein FoTM2_006395 [Fusarium oxysporum f. sp. vasinfectum]